MSAHPEAPRAALVAALVALVTLALGLAGAGSALAATDPPDPSPPPTYNEYYPAERDLSDCLSALPKPGCGSEARGGFHQNAVFVVLALGLAVIGTRIAIAIRRRDRELTDAGR